MIILDDFFFLWRACLFMQKLFAVIWVSIINTIRNLLYKNIFKKKDIYISTYAVAYSPVNVKEIKLKECEREGQSRYSVKQ